MTWGDVDAARAYIGGLQGGKLPSRKVVYKLVAAGLKVARLGDSGRRLLFCQEWIDEFLQASAQPAVENRRLREVK